MCPQPWFYSARHKPIGRWLRRLSRGLGLTPMIIANPLDWGVGEQPTRLFNDFKPAPDARLAARHGTDSAPLKVH